jgi:uncharacterized phage protein (TIGR01671 family)
MNRTIKFRGYNKVTGKMVDLKKITPFAIDTSLKGLFIPEDGNLELMQFTGLLDKNGKEVYEGDIVSFVYRTTKEELVAAKVVFRNGTFGYLQDSSIKKHIYSYEFWPLSEGKAKTVEVIGNIYENPELLNP